MTNHPRFKYEDIALLFHQLEESYTRCSKPYLHAMQLSKQQFRILRRLYEHGPMEPRQIVTHCAIPSPSLTGILIRMENLSLIHRQRIPQDQRRLLVSLSKKSERLLIQMIPQVNAAWERVQSQLPPGTINQFPQQARQLLKALRHLAVENEKKHRT